MREMGRLVQIFEFPSALARLMLLFLLEADLQSHHNFPENNQKSKKHHSLPHSRAGRNLDFCFNLVEGLVRQYSVICCFLFA